MQMIKNPVKTCDTVYSLIQSLTLQIRQRMEDPKSAGGHNVNNCACFIKALNKCILILYIEKPLKSSYLVTESYASIRLADIFRGLGFGQRVCGWWHFFFFFFCLTDIQLYHSETLELMLRRWSKLEKDFKMKNGRYNISKIPDIYDCIKYDVQHNSLLKLDNTMEIYRLSKALADIVIPQVPIFIYVLLLVKDQLNSL